jgi:radical SAM protein with 4Fe4S-binding SPASM domain
VLEQRNHFGKPLVAALELTLACPCRCETCGSAAGLSRQHELSTSEWLTVIADLAALGCKHVTLMGGEPLCMPDWPVLARAATELGMSADLVTSGVGIDRDCAARIRDTPLSSVTVSVDGTEAIHDRLRRVPGGYQQALAAIRWLDQAGMKVGVTSQVNPATLPTLEKLAGELQDAGAMGWQWQLTLPVGRAAGQPHLTMTPERMSELYRLLQRISRRHGLRPHITDNIGYCTEDDTILRTMQGGYPVAWRGCFAGLLVAGVMSDGSVKGCLALPDGCIEGNVRQEPLASIWNDPQRFAYNRSSDRETLSGACATCPSGAVCRGGCTAAAMALHGRRGVSSLCFRLLQTG